MIHCLYCLKHLIFLKSIQYIKSYSHLNAENFESNFSRVKSHLKLLVLSIFRKGMLLSSFDPMNVRKFPSYLFFQLYLINYSIGLHVDCVVYDELRYLSGKYCPHSWHFFKCANSMRADGTDSFHITV